VDVLLVQRQCVRDRDGVVMGYLIDGPAPMHASADCPVWFTTLCASAAVRLVTSS
jgi:hypothetical protein